MAAAPDPEVPFGAQQQEQARWPPAPTAKLQNRARQPVLWVPPTAPESAIERTRSGAEQRARSTAVAILAAARNGTYACAHGQQALSASGSSRYAVNR
jgi:hypothetical protein